MVTYEPPCNICNKYLQLHIFTIYTKYLQNILWHPKTFVTKYFSIKLAILGIFNVSKKMSHESE